MKTNRNFFQDFLCPGRNSNQASKALPLEPALLGLYYFRVHDDQVKSDIYSLFITIIVNERNLSQITYITLFKYGIFLPRNSDFRIYFVSNQA
jgi:hypothetical protein